jgi:SAM-dependent methyltransferase
VETTITAEIEVNARLEDFVEELKAALSRRGVRLENAPLVDPGSGRVVLEWRPTDWDPDDVCELEFQSDGSRVRVECRRFGRQFWSEEDLVGWFADEVAAPLMTALTPSRFGDWLTDRGARRPFGVRVRRDYKDPTFHRPSFGAILSALHLQPDDVLLELGSGGGAFLEQALRTGCRAVGLDHSEEMVRAAGELNAQAIADGTLELVLGDAHHLPFGDDTFTAAAAMQVFFFFADAQGVLLECRRVLKPSGRLAVFTVTEEAKGTPAAPEPMASRGQFYTDEELVEMAREAGFAVASVSHPDLEPFAREAGLPEDVVSVFAGNSGMDQLLLARRA